MISKSYCDAIFSIAQEEAKLSLYKEQLALVAAHVRDDARYRAVMEHPKIRKEEKKQLLDNVYKETLDHTLLNFLKLLVDKGRFSYVQEIAKEYTKEYNRINDIQVVYVKSVVALKAEDVARLRKRLEARLHKQVDFVLSQDSELIAGIRIKINDQVIDNSAAGRLKRLKRTVLNAQEITK